MIDIERLRAPIANAIEALEEVAEQLPEPEPTSKACALPSRRAVARMIDPSDMSDRELLETLVRWSESAGSSLTALELDIARPRRDLEAMEARLMRRIETVLTELRAVARNLRSEHDATHQLVAALKHRPDKLEKPPEHSLGAGRRPHPGVAG